jgi:hypothetical protein
MDSETHSPEESSLPVVVKALDASPPPMPPEIAKAIISVMKAVRAIGKDAKTDFGRKYAYVSVDAFYEQIGPLMAANGIFDLVLEQSLDVQMRVTVDEYNKEKKANWLIGVYHIYVYHDSGVFYGPIKREMQVRADGPQAYGSAPSYLEKYFLRQLFKVPTGDADADNHPQEGIPLVREPVRDINEDREDLPDPAKQKYVNACAATFGVINDIQKLGEWWKSEIKVMNETLCGKSDPYFIDLKNKFTTHAAALQKSKLDDELTKAADKPAETAKTPTKGETLTDDGIPF